MGSYRRECRLLPGPVRTFKRPHWIFLGLRLVCWTISFRQKEPKLSNSFLTSFLSFLLLVWTWKKHRIKGYPSLHCALSPPSWCFVPKLCSSYINDKGLSQAMHSQGSNDSKSRKSFTMQKKVWWISLPYIFLFTLTISNEEESFPMNVVERAMKLGGPKSQANHNGAHDFNF